MIRTALLLGALLYAAPAQSAEIKTGLELLVACSPTETSPQAAYDDCINAIILRVTELSGRPGNCPKLSSKDDIAFWVVNGRAAIVNYWSKVGVGSAAKLTPAATIDAPLKVMGYDACISATAL